MDQHAILLLLVSILLIVLLLLFSKKPTNRSKHPPSPPGPKPWPIIGHIHLLGSKPHISVANLSKIYGPIMSLKLGSITTIVISCPKVAEQMFLKHDLAFSSRQIPNAATATNHYKLSMVFLPVCPQWRNLRKIAAVRLFTNKQLESNQILRQKKIVDLLEFTKTCCEKGQEIDIGKAAFTTSLNMLSNTFFSVDFCSYGDLSESQKFKDLVWEFMEELGRPNVSDFFPVLKCLDLQGIKRRIKGSYLKMLSVFEEIIDERLRNSTIGLEDDVLGTLLKLVDEKELSLNEAKHMLVDLFVAGTDTTSNTLEWAMTEMLRFPEVMIKAQMELDKVIGEDKHIRESNITELTYLQAIVKETFRLHPPAPFLVPHKVIENVELCDYYVPKNAQVWVNVWSIGHDPCVWENQESFSPERFLNVDIDFKGQNFELTPFGAGRRICPGLPLAYRMLHLMLANLLHSFNWKLPNDNNSEDVDLEEKFGLTIQKVQPLKVISLFR